MMIKNPFSKNKMTLPVKLPDWLSPLPDTEPCGPNLEYDAEYAMLIASMTPRRETQYGDFIGTTEGPNWSEVERDCRRLLLRSRDITLAILFLRCRTRLAQAEGLREGLVLILALMEQYPEQVHPQLSVDGQFDPAVRANALAALSDPEGLLADIREIAIAKSSAIRLQVRDVERAHAIPHPEDALPLQAVHQQLDDLRHQKNSQLIALSDVIDLVEKLQKLMMDDLGELAPDLNRLMALVGLFSEAHAQPNTMVLKESPQRNDVSTVKGLQTMPASSGQTSIMSPVMNEVLSQTSQSVYLSGNPQEGRQAALVLIQQSRAWFEVHEPSSPVAILLRQAEKLVGKRFTEVANIIPLELLQNWEQQ